LEPKVRLASVGETFAPRFDAADEWDSARGGMPLATQGEPLQMKLEPGTPNLVYPWL